MDWMPQAVRDGIIVVLIISGPLVLAAAFIGLAIGILQAATQVQEQTIGSALKIIGVFALIIAAGFWMYQYLNQYTSRTLTTAFTIVPHRTQKVVPANSKEDDEQFTNQLEGNSINIEPPEKIETKFPEAGLPPPAQYTGSPSIPKIPPSTSKILPPESPSIPTQAIKSNIPISDFQEPISIPQTKMEDRELDEGLPPLNLLPDNQIKQETTSPKLQQREETFSENINDNSKKEEATSSWLD